MMQVVEDFSDIIPGREILFRRRKNGNIRRGTVLYLTPMREPHVRFINEHDRSDGFTVRPELYVCSLMTALEHWSEPTIGLALAVLTGQKAAAAPLVDRLIDEGTLLVTTAQETIRKILSFLDERNIALPPDLDAIARRLAPT